MKRPLLAILPIITVALLLASWIHGSNARKYSNHRGRDLVGAMGASSSFQALLDRAQDVINDNQQQVIPALDGKTNSLSEIACAYK